MPKKVLIGRGNEHRGARAEADDDGVRNEIDQGAQARRAHRELEYAGQKRDGENQADVVRRPRSRQRAEARENQNGDRVGRAGDHVQARPEQRRTRRQHLRRTARTAESRPARMAKATLRGRPSIAPVNPAIKDPASRVGLTSGHQRRNGSTFCGRAEESGVRFMSARAMTGVPECHSDQRAFSSRGTRSPKRRRVISSSSAPSV